MCGETSICSTADGYDCHQSVAHWLEAFALHPEHCLALDFRTNTTETTLVFGEGKPHVSKGSSRPIQTRT